MVNQVFGIVLGVGLLIGLGVAAIVTLFEASERNRPHSHGRGGPPPRRPPSPPPSPIPRHQATNTRRRRHQATNTISSEVADRATSPINSSPELTERATSPINSRSELAEPATSPINSRPELAEPATSPINSRPEQAEPATRPINSRSELAERATSPISSARHFSERCKNCDHNDREVVAFQPCGDYVMCRPCAEDFSSYAGQSNCPYCYRRIERIG